MVGNKVTKCEVGGANAGRFVLWCEGVRPQKVTLEGAFRQKPGAPYISVWILVEIVRYLYT